MGSKKDGQASKVQVREKEKWEWWTEPEWNLYGRERRT